MKGTVFAAFAALSSLLAISRGAACDEPGEPKELPATIEYARGETIPAGYAIDLRPPRSLVRGGTITFASSYGLAVLATAVYASLSGSFDESVAPALVPVVGPFIAAGTSNARGGVAYVLALDGIAQAAGLSMLIAAAAAEEEILVLRDPSPYVAGLMGAPLPRTMAYDRGPIPRGYRLERVPNTGFVKGGAYGLGASYLAAAVVGGWGLAEPKYDSGLWPLFIPLAGPFVAIGTSGLRLADDELALAFLFDGVAQSACLGLLIAGALTDRRLLVRNDVRVSSTSKMPDFDLGLGTLTLRWKL